MIDRIIEALVALKMYPNNSVWQIGKQPASVTNTGSTTESALFTATFGPLSATGRIELKFLATLTGSAANKTYNVRLNGVLVSAVTTNSLYTLRNEVAIYNQGATNAQGFDASRVTTSATAAANFGNTAIDTSGVNVLTITAQLTTASDAIAIAGVSLVRVSA